MADETGRFQRAERRPTPQPERSATDITPLADLVHGRSRTGPVRAERLLGLAQEAADQRWRLYEDMATRSAGEFPSSPQRHD